MIVAKLVSTSSPDGPVKLLLVVEPGNLAKLQRGEPILKRLNHFLPGLPQQTDLLIAYTPDIEWVAAKMTEEDADLEKILVEAQTRPAVMRDSSSAERLERSSDETRSV